MRVECKLMGDSRAWRRAIAVVFMIITLAACSHQVEQKSTFDPFCSYAVNELTDQISPYCIDNAEQNDPIAATNLGYLYSKGMLVEHDPQRAMALYHVAAEQGFPQAEYNLAELYRSGVYGEERPDLARYWYQKSAGQLPVEQRKEAEFMLGLLWLEGSGGEQDLAIAKQWLVESVDHGHAEAAYVLGNLYLDEENNVIEAIKWYQIATERNFGPAMHKMGLLYVDGSLEENDPDKAKPWLLRAATLGLPEGQVDLATLLYNSAATRSDYVQCYVWLSAADSQGFELASQRLKLLQTKLTAGELEQAQILSQACIESAFQRCEPQD
ncbi:tetratricopeptide repeat protein [Vibrio scophthalmi]|uniref:tetratricopeptide repeat protein n=1 Tax=Vibrio scophthalmi TaxID=45658 RepID=UPI003EB9AF21